MVIVKLHIRIRFLDQHRWKLWSQPNSSKSHYIARLYRFTIGGQCSVHLLCLSVLLVCLSWMPRQKKHSVSDHFDTTQPRSHRFNAITMFNIAEELFRDNMEISHKLHRKTERLYVIIMYTLYRTSSFSPKWVLKTACMQYLFNEYLKLCTFFHKTIAHFVYTRKIGC